jgi:CheY-like chemotaxis protein
LHILVADDEAVNRKIMARLLAKLGCTCECVSEGDEAIDALIRTGQARPVASAPTAAATPSPTGSGQRPFDAFLSDIIMNRTDGAETCAQLRAMGCAIPIYAVTGNASFVDACAVDPATGEAAQGGRPGRPAFGFNGVVCKPFDQPALLRVLREVLALR